MIEQLVTRPADVIHDFVASFFLKRLAHPSGDVIENLVPRHPFPFAFASPADPLERIFNALRISHLIERCRALGAISSPATRVLRITFKPSNTVAVFLDDRDQTASRLAVKTDSWNDPAVLLYFSWPMGGVVFHPVVPFFDSRKIGQATTAGFEVCCNRVKW